MTKEAKGIIIYPDGTWEHRVFTQLKDYQQVVGGLIEAVRLFDYTYENEVATIYVNEEGRLIDLRIHAVS